MYEVHEITVEELKQMMHQQRDVTIIDVREHEEVAQGMIPTAKHIPLTQIPESLEQFSHDQEYIMVCRIGARSMNACLFLAQHGYTAINLAGGMLDWDGELR